MKNKLLAIVSIVLATASCSSLETINTVSTTSISIPENHYTLGAVGDIACSTQMLIDKVKACKDEEVSDIARSQNLDLLFVVGDIQYNSHSYREFVDNYLDRWGDMRDITKPAAGNHEYSDGKGKGYYKSWNGIPSHYSLDIGERWHAVVLNTNCQFVSCAKNSEQYDWLRLDLSNNRTKCVVAFGHHPRYSSGVHGDNPDIEPLYELMGEYGVVVYISGHDHHYERISGRIPQIVIGTGGADLRRVSRARIWADSKSEFINDRDFGILKLSIDNNIITSQFITTSQKVVDEKPFVCS